MQTRRDFCKNLAAAIASASLPVLAKAYCGMDFGKDGDCGEIAFGKFEDGIYFMGGYMSGRHAYSKLLNDFFEENALYGAEKSKRKKQEEEYKWLWFEEASEFENYTKKGMKND